ncbi:hypothetical protein BH20CHL6_BH20CHL6_16560 [soil metagenome]
MDQRQAHDEDEARPETVGTSGGGSVPADDEASASLSATAQQVKQTSLEGTTAERSVEELATGAERAQREPGYGREGQ